jgi:fatty acid desaturase
MNDQIKINWYRTEVDKKVMSELMKKSDFQGFRQVLLQLGLYLATAMLAYVAFRNIHSSNWMWAVPLFLLALFIHGTFSTFLTYVAIHELCHKTPFRTMAVNEFFLKLYSFMSRSDPVWFRASHVKHHQYTVHHDLDGEVILPAKFDWYSVKFLFSQLLFDPYNLFCGLRNWFRHSRGDVRDPWVNKVLGDTGSKLRQDHRRWARIVVYGHLALATLFIASGNWILIPIFTFGCNYASWLGTLCGAPQHAGMTPDVPDFRLSCRTFTCGRFIGFLYWNMQYHVEHHMFPAVPFYHLPKLRKAIEHDLPPCTHGLWATWMEIIDTLQKQKEDPNYFYVPRIPQSRGTRVGDTEIESEAAAQSYESLKLKVA